MRCRGSGAVGSRPTYHVVEPDAQIVYSYVMYHDDVRLSVSLTSIELDAIDDGAATRLVFTEQGAYFEGGDAAHAAREEGTDRPAEATGGDALMAQLLKVQNFARVARRLRRRRGPEPRAAVRVTPIPLELMSWAGATASWPNRTEPGGTRGLDDFFTRDFANNIGAEIMGRNKFGPDAGPVARRGVEGMVG